MKQKKDSISKIISYIEAHLSEDLSLDHIAKFAGYSKFHLNRLFTEEVGCTIHKYIKECRLTEAAKSLTQTDKSIVDIAYEAKYESQQAFTLAFRQFFYYPPNVYRQFGILKPKRINLKKDKKKDVDKKKYVFYNKIHTSSKIDPTFLKIYGKQKGGIAA